MGNHFRTWILLGTLSAVLVGLGAMLGHHYTILFAAMAVAMNCGAWWFSDRLVLSIHRAAELAPDTAQRLHSMVLELAHSAGIPAPRIFLIEDEQPNAFATGRNPEHGVVAVTTGLLRRMPDRELRGILAHELAHIRHRDTLVASIAASVAGAISYASQTLSFGWLFGGHHADEEDSGAGILALLAAPVVGLLLQMAISRSREYLADETAARLTGDPGALASALRRLEEGVRRTAPARAVPATAGLFIVNPLTGLEAIGSLFSTHPPTRLRIQRLEAMMTSSGAGMAAD